MALYHVFVQDSSPLFVYSPPGAWIDTPLELNDSPSPSYHATDAQNATVTFDFVGTGVHVFSATIPTPGSYQVYVDGQSLSDLSSHPGSQLLLGSITGLEMAPHTLTLVNSGVTGDVLNLAHVEVESLLVDGSPSFSAATFDDTADEIQWGPGWVSALGESTFYNSTIHYTGQIDAQMSFLFEGNAIAIYGTSGAEMGYYVVELDGEPDALNGGSDGSVRIEHNKILYFANGLSSGRHELTITANPSSLGDPRVFNVDCIRVLSSTPSSGPVLFPTGPPDTGPSSALPPPVPTGLSYASVISSTVFLTPVSLPTSTSSTIPLSLMSPPSSNSPTPSPTADFDNFRSTHVLRGASDNGAFKVITGRWVISGAIVSGIIAGIGLFFFALFMWKRKTLDPPSYIDLEKANKSNKKGQMAEPVGKSPELPIQLTGKINPEEQDNLFAGGAPYVRYQSRAERKRGHSWNGSNASSITVNESAYNSYREMLQKRAKLTSSIVWTDSTRRDSRSDYDWKDPGHIENRGKSAGGVLSVYGHASPYSQISERIFINGVRMPPQFLTPTRLPSVASPPRSKLMSPPRPPRVRETLALPF